MTLGLMKKIVNRVITLLLLCLGFFVKFLSIKQRNCFGKLIGDLLRLLSKSRRKITLDNISQAFPNNLPSENQSILKNSYRNLGISLIELLALRYLSDEEVKKYIKYNNLGLLLEKYNEGRGLILMSGHYGNWELLAYSVKTYTDIPVHIIVKPQSNESADKLLNSYRTKGGNSIVSMYKAAFSIVRTLKKAGVIAMLVDQSATKDRDVFVDFFGRPAATYIATAELALSLDCPIIMGFAVRESDCTYRVDLKEIKFDDIKEHKDAVRILTERHVKALEEQIRSIPSLWAWQHKRWKHSPVS
jgi:KDO2-lipid IV(A) lauroyltransferase